MVGGWAAIQNGDFFAGFHAALNAAAYPTPWFGGEAILRPLLRLPAAKGLLAGRTIPVPNTEKPGPCFQPVLTIANSASKGKSMTQAYWQHHLHQDTQAMSQLYALALEAGAAEELGYWLVQGPQSDNTPHRLVQAWNPASALLAYGLEQLARGQRLHALSTWQVHPLALQAEAGDGMRALIANTAPLAPWGTVPGHTR